VLTFEGCPHAEPALDLVELLLREDAERALRTAVK
jgi:hypothetical protein